MSMTLNSVTGTEHDAGMTAGAGGEFLAVTERVVIAPQPGRFEPAVLPGVRVTKDETVIGTIVHSNSRIEVVCQVSGEFMGHLADSGERVRDGQPVAWVRLPA